MKCKEPAPGLVDTFGNIIGREHLAEISLILKRVMYLGIRHRTRIKPSVDQISFTDHFLSGVTNKKYIVNKRPVKVKMFIVLR